MKIESLKTTYNTEQYSKITAACYKLISKLPINENETALMAGISHSDLIYEFYFSYDEALLIHNQLRLESNRFKHQKITFKINENKNRKKILKECGCQEKSVEIKSSTFGALPLKSHNAFSSSMMSSRPSSKNSLPMEHTESQETKKALYDIIQDAKELLNQLNFENDLPEWTQEKIWTAKDRISSVKYYLNYNQGLNHE